ncbi:hypothetical protein SAMN04489732_110257 [Amycolatopsis saalfeldensis]|uniref:Uncharacterized protein n=1 Tax=Amycolatopsis saalfeldensis TaxID=394193 RepID=A0A1H8Y4I0_9PSEU|nr:hypothetical protein SAMN04489732_110257 [Amycolatopsis saalfeldensis]
MSTDVGMRADKSPITRHRGNHTFHGGPFRPPEEGEFHDVPPSAGARVPGFARVAFAFVAVAALIACAAFAAVSFSFSFAAFAAVSAFAVVSPPAPAGPPTPRPPPGHGWSPRRLRHRPGRTVPRFLSRNGIHRTCQRTRSGTGRHTPNRPGLRSRRILRLAPGVLRRRRPAFRPPHQQPERLHPPARGIRVSFFREPHDTRRHHLPRRRLFDRGRFPHLSGWRHLRSAVPVRRPRHQNLGIAPRPGPPNRLAPGRVDSQPIAGPRGRSPSGPAPWTHLPPGASTGSPPSRGAAPVASIGAPGALASSAAGHEPAAHHCRS